MTVLFADVVHSMDIAAAVGTERLREIMAELADRCAAVVQRYGGTVDKFTGDGIMAVFGARDAMEDSPVSPGVVDHGQRRERVGPHAAGIRGGWLGCPPLRRVRRMTGKYDTCVGLSDRVRVVGVTAAGRSRRPPVAAVLTS